MELGLLDILGLFGFDRKSEARLVRHQSSLHPVRELLRNNWLDVYQAYQSKPVFHRVERIVSMYGADGTRARFYGVYRVVDILDAGEGPATFDWARQWQKDGKYYYVMERDRAFDDLRDRLIIDWGPGTLAWVQHLTNKPVLEITPPGRSLPPFEDYLEFSLTHAQLKVLFANEDAHREWRARLQAVGGVYLILAETTGELYVGSASGAQGIWGRWSQYAKSGHGGNKLLIDLMKKNPDYPENFRFSILQILPKTMAQDKIVEREQVYKRKLGTCAHGLNSL